MPVGFACSDLRTLHTLSRVVLNIRSCYWPDNYKRFCLLGFWFTFGWINFSNCAVPFVLYSRWDKLHRHLTRPRGISIVFKLKFPFQIHKIIVPENVDIACLWSKLRIWGWLLWKDCIPLFLSGKAYTHIRPHPITHSLIHSLSQATTLAFIHTHTYRERSFVLSYQVFYHDMRKYFGFIQ